MTTFEAPDRAQPKPVEKPSDAFLEALLDEATDGPWLADQCWLRGPRDVFMGGTGAVCESNGATSVSGFANTSSTRTASTCGSRNGGREVADAE